MSLKETNKPSPKTTSNKSTRTLVAISNASKIRNSPKSNNTKMMPKNLLLQSRLKSKSVNQAPSKKPNSYTKNPPNNYWVSMIPSSASKIKKALSTVATNNNKERS